MLWKYKKCYQETSEIEDCGTITLTSVEEVLCEEVTAIFRVSFVDIQASDDGVIYFQYVNCSNIKISEILTDPTSPYTFCIKENTSPTYYMLINNQQTLPSNSTLNILNIPC